MKRYIVSFWFGSYTANPFIAPSHVVEIESDRDLSNKEATEKALESIKEYPKTYATLVQRMRDKKEVLDKLLKYRWVAYGKNMLGYTIIETEGRNKKEAFIKVVEQLKVNQIDFEIIEPFDLEFRSKMKWE